MHLLKPALFNNARSLLRTYSSCHAHHHASAIGLSTAKLFGCNRHHRYSVKLPHGTIQFHFYSKNNSKTPNKSSEPNPEFDIVSEKKTEPQRQTIPVDEPVAMKKRLMIVAAVLVVYGTTYLFAKYMRKQKNIEEREANLSKVDIGAQDYELVDHTGKLRTKADFLGQWLLLYFGFTHCPDICPEELEKMSEIIDLIDGDRSVPNLQPIFISVDPERDTPEVVEKYIHEFHKKFIGLTGSKEQVKQAAKAFRVYFSAGPKDEDNDYIVDHTIVMYLMNPKGLFVDYYGSRGIPNKDIVAGIKNNMKNYARLHGP